MGTPGPNFFGKLGIPLGKWGPLVMRSELTDLELFVCSYILCTSTLFVTIIILVYQ